jgi:hypothetical protein
MQCMIITKDSITAPADMFKIGTHPTLACTCIKNNQEPLHGLSERQCQQMWQLCIPTHLQCTGGRQSQFSISDASNTGTKILWLLVWVKDLREGIDRTLLYSKIKSKFHLWVARNLWHVTWGVSWHYERSSAACLIVEFLS